MAHLPSLATLEEFGIRLGIEFLDEYDEPTSPEGVQAQAALDDASALVRSEAGLDWVDEYGDLEIPLPDIAVSITLAVAGRVLQNPQGFSQATVGDSSVSYSREGNAGSLYLTKSERSALRRLGGKPGYGEIILEKPYELRGTQEWVEVTNGGDPFPYGPVA